MVKVKEDKVTLYSLKGCGKCRVLEEKLRKSRIKYEKLDHGKSLERLGISTVPILEVNGERLSFLKANEWINSQMEGI